MFVNHISHDDECGLHAWPWKMDRIGVIILTANYLSLAISQQLLSHHRHYHQPILEEDWTRLTGLFLVLQFLAPLHHSGHLEARWVNLVGS